ncbi:hypothetical protein EV175_000313 [Coemansia sp. RSA 1933]|nr:hypothetical protein EV175_000313 [Coemansia sp. RSA 1933]
MTVAQLSAQGLIFDLDGTLINTQEETERAYTKYAQQHGIDPQPIIDYCHGVPTLQVLRKFFPEQVQTAEYAQMMELDSITEMDGLREIAGARSLVDSVPGQRWAIFTSGMPFLAHPRMKHLGLPIPAVFVTPADIVNGKPHPEGYVRAAQGLGFDPQRCIVFEDAKAGISAGVAAGAVVVGIRTLLTDAELKAAGAQYSVADMTRVSVAVQDDGSLVVAVDES